MLTNVIKEAKRSMYNNQVINSTTEMKTAWNTIKSETSKLNGHTISKYQNSPEAFNKYFLSIGGKIIHDIR
jgi:hypothetical protein